MKALAGGRSNDANGNTTEAPRRRILILDDDADINNLMKACLGEEDYEFMQCFEGNEALAKIESFKPDLIILDVYHPGTDGVDVCRSIKANPATMHIPVILITALDVKGKFFTPWKESPDYYLRKPFEPTLLRALVNRIFKQTSEGEEPAELRRLVKEHEFIESKTRSEPETIIDVSEMLNPSSSSKGPEVNPAQTKVEAPTNGMNTRALAIGVGGCGCNMINHMQKNGIHGCEFLCVETDQKYPNGNGYARSLLIGKTTANGGGNHGNVELGRKCAEEDAITLKQELKGYNLVLIFLGLGGGTGTGAAPYIAELAQQLGATTIAIAAYPFKLERARLVKAEVGLKELREKNCPTILFDNNLLAKIVPGVNMNASFAMLDDIIGRTAESIIRAYRPGVVKKT